MSAPAEPNYELIGRIVIARKQQGRAAQALQEALRALLQLNEVVGGNGWLAPRVTRDNLDTLAEAGGEVRKQANSLLGASVNVGSLLTQYKEETGEDFSA